MEKPTPNKRRMLRRRRADFRRDLGGGDMSRAERVLVEQAALVALRTREMQDQIIAGAQIDDEDFVRLVRATSSIMKPARSIGTGSIRRSRRSTATRDGPGSRPAS